MASNPADAASKTTPLQDTSPASSTATAAAGGGTASAATAAAPAKRQRVSRACDQCRAMREKCDGSQPQCSSCVTQRRACSYKTSPKKRGVQTGYIRTLELTLSSLLDEVPGCAEAVDTLFGGEAAGRLFHPEASGNQQKDLDRQNRLHRRWHKSRARKEINRLLSTEGFGSGPARAMSDRASDDDTDSGGGGGGASGGGLAAARNGQTMWSPDNTIPSPLSGIGGGLDDMSGSRLPLPPHHWRLLDVYFSYTHCWFPILERQDLLKTVYQHEREANEPTSAPSSSTTSSAAMAELWSVLALASFHNAASRRQQQDASHSSIPSTNSTVDPPSWPPHRIYHAARQMIPLDDGPFEIQHARALLLLALVNIGRRRYTAARVLVALSHQIAQDMSSDQRPLPTRRVVDAVTSGCCILNVFLNVVRTFLGQQRAAPSAPHACPALPEDGLDEWQPWVPCSGFGIEDGAPSERSPAYSLTTFNQLHALFTFMQAEQRQSSSPVDYNDVIVGAAGWHGFDKDALDRVLRPDVPFAAFARSAEQAPRASAGVPSAFVLRITFVWMKLLLAQRAGGNGADQAHVLADVLEQFIARFGAAGAPPTLVPCLSTVIEHPSFRTLPPPLQQRLGALGDALGAVWHVQEQQHQAATSTARTNAVLQQNLPAVPPQNTPVPPPTALAMNTTTVVYHHSASPEAAVAVQQQQQQQLQQQQRPPTIARHHRISFLEAQQPPPGQQQQAPASNMYSGSHTASGPAFGFHALPISPQTTAGDHQAGGYPQIMGAPYVGVTAGAGSGTEMAVDFGGSNGLDCDALLDDLSAVDYLDRLDTDIGSQFMANLGFAPGSDNLGMMGDFGGL